MPEVNFGRQMMADAKFFESYSRYIDELDRYETWDESVSRVMDTHRTKYKDKMSHKLSELILEAEKAYKNEEVLGSQRALQFGGEQLLSHEIRLYNCGASYIDRPAAFGETMYSLLGGCGIGFSVQKHHVDKLPKLQARGQRAKTYTVDDSIEGWSHSFDVLLSSYFSDNHVHPEYKKCHVAFDLSNIRLKGAKISGGFKAPGPEPLRKALTQVESLLNKVVQEGGVLRPIHVYDVIMYMADAVLAGGVRRSATIAVFSPDDEEMMSAKTGSWGDENPQRARSNNSALLLRDEVTLEDMQEMTEKIKQFGEPGFVLSDSTEFVNNPCVEITFMPVTKDGKTGFQFCNLCEINGGITTNKEMFFSQCRNASILGTLQAGYTNFKFMTKETIDIVKREALLGVSITGWMENPHILFDEEILAQGAQIVKDTNKEVAELIGINQSARTTCVKPSGNASTKLKTTSGIHGEHSKQYIRNVQMNKETEVAKLLKSTNPIIVEDSLWKDTDYCVSFPVIAKDTAKFKDELIGVPQLEYVKLAQQVWVEGGTNIDLCVDPRLRHNVSNTIQVKDWDEVIKYVFDNRAYFAGVSFLEYGGDRSYTQAPFTSVFTGKELLDMYGEAVIFASGLVVDGLHAFNQDLWLACNTLLGIGKDISEETSENALKRDWIRRAKKFAHNYFDDDLTKCTYSLKDVENLHKWTKIQQTLTDIDWIKQLEKKDFTDVDTMGAIACASGVCEIEF